MEDKHTLYNKLLELNANFKKCKKISLINIVFPNWDELDVINDMFRQVVKTKEHPEGFLYNEANYRVVLRIYNGRLYDDSNMADSYCWSNKDVLSKSKKVQPIGINSPIAILNLCSVLNSMINEDEKLKIAGMFSSFNKNLLYIESKEEHREVVEITEDLYNKGITSCIDEWVDMVNNEYIHTPLNIGDYLVINHENKTLYRIEKDAFLATHEF